MRLIRPKEPIGVHADDIDAAFCQILYNPEMAIAFAYCFTAYIRLQTCRACLIPSEVLRTLASLISSPNNEVKTSDARGENFIRWCRSAGLEEHHILAMDDSTIIMMLATYIDHVKQGFTCQGTEVMGATLNGYLTAAHIYIELIVAPRRVSIKDVHTPDHIHPFIRDHISEKKKWERKKPQKEPYTTPMFEWIWEQLLKRPDKVVAFLEVDWTVFDTQRLGVFTGSRISEYGQQKLKKWMQFWRIPDTPDAGEWRNQALAFLRYSTHCGGSSLDYPIPIGCV